MPNRSVETVQPSRITLPPDFDVHKYQTDAKYRKTVKEIDSKKYETDPEYKMWVDAAIYDHADQMVGKNAGGLG